MAESTALAEQHTDSEQHDERIAASGRPSTVAAAASTAVTRVRPEPLVAEELVAEELLVEEVSIDGMCGVY